MRIGARAATAAALSLAAAWAAPASADADFGQYVNFSGFSTLGAVHSDYAEADFTGTVNEPRGAGFSGRWSPTPDSDLGVQANLTFTDRLSGVVQVLSRDDANGNFAPELEWANLKLQVTPDLAVRVGRVLLPTFERSDIQNVGYSLPWVRVPVEITYASTATHSDGLDVLYHVDSGPISQEFEAQGGIATEALPGIEFTSNHDYVILVGDTLRRGDVSAYLVHQQCIPKGSTPTRLHLTGAGLTYDPGRWFLAADSNYTQDRYFGDLFAWYATVGVRLGPLAPYALFSSVHQETVGSSELRTLGNQHTEGLGARWDFARNVDFKLQFERVTIDTWNDPASFAMLQPGLKVGDRAHVLSLTVDFVF